MRSSWLYGVLRLQSDGVLFLAAGWALIIGYQYLMAIYLSYIRGVSKKYQR